MSNLTTLEIGGNAKYFITVKNIEELNNAIEYAKNNDLEFLIIGSGSNLLVSDEGVDKLIIKNEITGITTSKESKSTFEVKVKSGTILQELVDYCIEHSLSGLQKLSGIPGTVGGAIYGNAGAYGQSISDHLVQVAVIPSHEGIQLTIKPGNRLLDPRLPARSAGGRGDDKSMEVTKKECRFGYRDSVFKKTKDLILEVTFSLENGDPEILKKESEEIKSQRNKKYPPGIKCPGSFFKNIVADTLSKEILEKIPQEKIIYGKVPAGTLLEEVGAKGDKLGDIEIAPYHANLFINNGKGNAKDFYTLAKKYVNLIKEKYGIMLEPEVQLINLPTLT